MKRNRTRRWKEQDRKLKSIEGATSTVSYFVGTADKIGEINVNELCTA